MDVKEKLTLFWRLKMNFKPKLNYIFVFSDWHSIIKGKKLKKYFEFKNAH